MPGDRRRMLTVRLILSTDFWDEIAFLKLQISCLLKYAINLYASHNLFSITRPTKYIEPSKYFLASYVKGNISQNKKIIFINDLIPGRGTTKILGLL